MDTKNCLVCGKEFVPCSVCGGDEMLRWRRVVCCPEHFAFHLILIKYSRALIDRQTAKKELNDAVSRYGSIVFTGAAQKIAEEILATKGS